jgi:hypothetical protein
MKTHHDTFSVSKIGVLAFKQYFIPLLYGVKNQLHVKAARKHTNAFGTHQAVQFALENRSLALYVGLRTVRENLVAKSDVTDIPRPHPRLTRFTKGFNTAMYHVHLFMLIPTSLTWVGLLRAGRRREARQIAIMAWCMAVVILTAGITFWQGDRIIAPILPVSITLYLMVVALWVDHFRGARRQRAGQTESRDR